MSLELLKERFNVKPITSQYEEDIAKMCSFLISKDSERV